MEKTKNFQFVSSINIPDMEKLQILMNNSDLDALVASSFDNVTYLTGIYQHYVEISVESLQMDNAVIIFRNDIRNPVLIANSFAADYYAKRTWIQDIRVGAGGWYVYIEGSKVEPRYESTGAGITQVLKERGITGGKVGIDAKTFNVDKYWRLKRELPAIEYLDATDILFDLRVIKSELEVERLIKAVKADEAGLRSVIENAEAGMTVDDLVKLFAEGVAKGGGDYIYALFGAGRDSFRLLSSPSEQAKRRIQQGDQVFMDVDAEYFGYQSDILRVLSVGKPSEKLAKLHSTCVAAEEAAIEVIRPGIKASEIFKAAQREFMKNYPGYSRPIGHSIGLVLEEPPLLTPDEDVPIREGMVLCIETPYYLSEVGGCGMEDEILVTKDGCKSLSTMTKELSII